MDNLFFSPKVLAPWEASESHASQIFKVKSIKVANIFSENSQLEPMAHTF